MRSIVAKAQQLQQELVRSIQILRYGKREQRVGIITIGTAVVGVALLQAKRSMVGERVAQIIGHRPIEIAGLLFIGMSVVGFVVLLVLLAHKATPPPVFTEALGPSVVKGPLAFGPQDGQIFLQLGRRRELETLLGYILEPKIGTVGVFGESGSGKTSLLRAGLPETLKNRGVRFIYWEATPSNPEVDLLKTISNQVAVPLQSSNMMTSLLSAAVAVSSSDEAVIAIDQLEQLDPENPTHSPVFQFIVDSSNRSVQSRITVIGAFTSESGAMWMELMGRNPEFHPKLLSVRPFLRREARDVMAVLAAAASLQLDEALLTDIIATAARGDRVSPVHLGIALLVLTNLASRSGRSELTIRDYQFAGGAEGILVAYVQEQLTTINAQDRQELLQVLLKLISPGTNQRLAEGLTVDKLSEGLNLRRERLQSYMEYFASAHVRLLESVKLDEIDHVDRYRLAHEQFIGPLRRLTATVLARTHQARLQFERAFAIWSANPTEQYLLKGRPLRESDRFWDQFAVQGATPEQVHYLKLSRARRRRSRVMGGLTLLLLLALAVAGYQWALRSATMRDLVNWGLPADLAAYARGLESLDVNSSRMTDTSWIQGNLRDLRVSSFSLRRIQSLPPRLNRLSLEFSLLTELERLPKITHLTELSVESNYGPDGVLSLLENNRLKKLKWGGAPIKAIPAFDSLGDLEVLELTGTAKFHNLAGVSRLVHLRDLNVSGGQDIASLKELRGLSQLVSLNISNTGHLHDSESLTYLPNLAVLHIEDATLDSFDGFSRLKHLAAIHFGKLSDQTLPPGLEALQSVTSVVVETGSDFHRLAEFRRLSNLRSLTVRGAMKSEDLSALPFLTKLESLDLENCEIRDLHEISKLTGLRVLQLHGNQSLRSLDGLEKLQNLTAVDIGGTGVSDLTPLSFLKHVEDLDLSEDRQIMDFRVLEQLVGLTALSLNDDSGLSTLVSLQNLERLKSLDISDDKNLSSLAGITHLKSITQLNISGDSSLELDGIEQMTALIELNMSSNERIQELSPLSKLTNLQKLNLSDNDQIESLSGVDLPNSLTSLDLRSTGLEELHSVKVLPNLVSLDLSLCMGLKRLDGLERFPRLQSLNLLSTSVDSLKGLPVSVKSLTIGSFF